MPACRREHSPVVAVLVAATLLLGHAAHADAADAALLDAAKAAQPAVIESLKHARDE